MSRWEVYSFLKQVNGQATTKDLIDGFPEMNYEELSEGIEEYNLMAKREGHFAECIA